MTADWYRQHAAAPSAAADLARKQIAEYKDAGF
jgi:hypothetical protein